MIRGPEWSSNATMKVAIPRAKVSSAQQLVPLLVPVPALVPVRAMAAAQLKVQPAFR